jgi:uncharacterized membrane protein
MGGRIVDAARSGRPHRRRGPERAAARPGRCAPPAAILTRATLLACDARTVTELSFDDVMELVVHGFEIGGVAILVVGSLAAFVSAALSYRQVGLLRSYEAVRRNVGRAILLGLEFLIIADIVLTITVDPTLKSALALGLIVLVRTFLSFSLEVELEGTLPWRRARAGTGAGPQPAAGTPNG